MIALPLQRAPRDLGNSVFLDQNLEPFPDEQQWDVLANVVRIDGKRVASLLKLAPSADTTRENRVPASSRARESAPRWHTGDLFANAEVTPKQLASGGAGTPARSEDLPSVEVVVRDRVYVRRELLPDPVQTRIVDLALFRNPEYFRKKAARVST